MITHVVRDVGGLGDMVRIFAALDGLRETDPETVIRFYGQERYARLVMNHCAAMASHAEYVPLEQVRVRLRRGAPLTRLPGMPFPLVVPEGDRLIDLYCPAWRHECETQGTPTRERTKIFCAEAGVEAREPRIRMTREAAEIACRYRDQFRGRPYVLLHFESAAMIRSWWANKLRGLGSLLDKAGFGCVYLPKKITMEWSGLIGLIAAVDAAIGVDSGPLHVAGAIGKKALGLFGPTNGALITSVYPGMRYLQAPALGPCQGQCYGYVARGFAGGECLDGCRDLAAVTPEAVFEAFRTMVGGSRP